MSQLNLGDLELTSPDFSPGGAIPGSLVKTATSPTLRWRGGPESASTFALVMHDPDAPLLHGFTHWVVYNIPGGTTELAQGAVHGFTVGLNEMGRSAYLPPDPPPGHGVHRYYFHLFALGDGAPLKAGLDRSHLLSAIEDRVLVQARLVGTYER